MSSFSCPHFDLDSECCLRIRRICVPGRPGCVLANSSEFVMPLEDRIRAREREVAEDQQLAEAKKQAAKKSRRKR